MFSSQKYEDVEFHSITYSKINPQKSQLRSDKKTYIHNFIKKRKYYSEEWEILKLFLLIFFFFFHNERTKSF